jgi:hypothetical protein
LRVNFGGSWRSDEQSSSLDPSIRRRTKRVARISEGQSHTRHPLAPVAALSPLDKSLQISFCFSILFIYKKNKRGTGEEYVYVLHKYILGGFRYENKGHILFTWQSYDRLRSTP